MDVFKKVAEIFNELTGEENINLKDNLQEDLAMDSIGLVTLLVNIEDIFGIELDESDMDPYELVSVEDTVELVEKYLGDGDE